jgi:ubiquitin C-terminal hydrolase
LSTILNLESSFITRQKGAWLIDVTKESNYKSLSLVDKEKLNVQIEKMILKKYKFINYNGIRKDNIKNMTNNFTRNLFDNTVVIIDEGHNLISRIVNKINNLPKKSTHHFIDYEKSPLSLILYELLLSAKNARVVILTGTPIINYPNEFGILFNILRGYIKTWNFQLRITDKADTGSFRRMFQKEKYIDYLDYNSSSKILTVTKTPFDFYDVVNKTTDEYEGITNIYHLKTGKEITDINFQDNIKKILSKNNITFNFKENDIINYKCLPDKLDEFIFMFLDETTGQTVVKNMEMLKKRIVGLTSYFKSAQEELLPRYEKKDDFNIVEIPMSDYQFTLYERERQKERKQEKFNKKKVEDLYKDSSSTYRIFSRLFCNFVMPEEHPRPFPNKNTESEETEEETEKEEIKQTEKEEKKKREKCPNGTKKNKEGVCVDKDGNIVNKSRKVKKIIVIEPTEEEKEEIKRKQQEKEQKEREKEKKQKEKEEKEKEKERKKKEKEDKEREEKEKKEKEKEDKKKEKEEKGEKEKRKKCPNGTKKNKEGNCVDKEGNIVNKTRRIKTVILEEEEIPPLNLGIKNGINACWLISSLQLLFHITEFKDCLLNSIIRCNDKRYKNPYISLKSIFKDLSKSKVPIKINQEGRSYYEELGKMIFLDKDFRGREMDAHEALNNIISMFVPDKKIEPVTLDCNGVPIYHLFSYKSNNTTYCQSKGVKTKEELNAVNSKNIMLFLPYSKGIPDIQESINRYTLLQELETSLERCNGGDKSFEKLNIFQNTNNYFLINLSRQDASGRKLNYSININKELLLKNESDEDIVFGLYGVICHFGGSNGGHYTYCSYDNRSNFMYEYSDDHIPSKREPDIKRYATVILYKRREQLQQIEREEREEEEEEPDKLRILVDNADAIAKDGIENREKGDDYIEGGKEDSVDDANYIYVNVEGGMTEEDIVEEKEEDIEIGKDDDEEDGEEEDLLNKMGDDTYEQRIEEALTFLKEHERQYLSFKGLNVYSPKYLALIQNILNKENIGLHLIYSQFRTLEGIGIFTLVLDANGFAQFRLKKGVNGKWQIKENAHEKGKLKYALYTGKESAEEKELIRQIYNGEWNGIPSYLKEELEKISTNNNLGEVIKCLMITASGSEGINLRNTRFVHLMEPYWNPVRSDQVIGRARRICSHQHLPDLLKTVTVYLYLMTFTTKQLSSEISNELKKKDLSKKDNKTPFTSDQTLFEISLEKETINNQLYKCIKESSIDCMVYSKANKKEGITCLNFGTSSPDEFAYKPDYRKEENDVEQKLNQDVIDFKVRPFTYKKMSYVMNINTGDIYKNDDYTNRLGVMIRNPEGKLVPRFY